MHMGPLTLGGPPDWHPAPGSVLEAAREAVEWCAVRAVSIEEVALRFALANPLVTSTLVGMRDAREVEMNLDALNGITDPEILEGVRAILEPAVDVDWMVGLPENNESTV